MKKHILLASAAVLALGLAFPAFAANDSFIDQIGTDNTASADQSGGASNTSDILQGQVGDPGTNNSAMVTQAGVSGTNMSTVTQKGDWNTAEVEQGDTGSGTHTSTITQTGDGTGTLTENFASVSQNGASDVSTVTQNGNSNSAMVTQN